MKQTKASQYCLRVTDGTHDSPKEMPTGKFLITSKHLRRFSLDYSTAYKISEQDYLKINERSQVEQWDILFSMIGTIGNLYLETRPVVDYACKNVGIFKMGGNREKAIWLFYYLQSPEGKAYIHSHLRGTTQMYVPLDSLREMPIPSPDEITIRKINQLLFSLDRKIELNSKINGCLMEQIHSFFEDRFGSVTELIPLSCITEKVTDGVHNTVLDEPGSGYKLLSCKNLKSGQLEISTAEREIGKETFLRLRKRTKLSKGDLLVASVGTIGEIVLLDEDPVFFEFQRSVAIIKPKLSMVSPYYLYEALASRRSELINKAHGAVQQCLFISDIASFEVAKPSTKQDVDSFDRVVEPLFERIRSNKNEIKGLSILRDALLPKLMSGEIDVDSIQLDQ